VTDLLHRGVAGLARGDALARPLQIGRVQFRFGGVERFRHAPAAGDEIADHARTWMPS
jgi:hypothetical protein